MALLGGNLSAKYWLAAFLGYRVPESQWRWGLAVMLAQAVVLILGSSDFGFLPRGLILFSVLALPAIGLAKLMANCVFAARNLEAEMSMMHRQIRRIAIRTSVRLRSLGNQFRVGAHAGVPRVDGHQIGPA
jgi:hypothetical protein